MIVPNNFAGNGLDGVSLSQEIYREIRVGDYLALELHGALLTVLTAKGAAFMFNLDSMGDGLRSDVLHACLNEAIIIGSDLAPLYQYGRVHCRTRWQTQASLDAGLYASAVFGAEIPFNVNPVSWFHATAGMDVGAKFEAVLLRLIEIDNEATGGDYFTRVERKLHARLHPAQPLWQEVSHEK